MAEICPDCSAELAEKNVNGVPIHPCANCGGVWFDHGKLQDLRTAQPDNLQQLDAEEHGTVAPSDQLRERACPACKGVLNPYRYALNANIELDVCHDCRGIWVPCDEVKTLADTLRKNPMAAQAAAPTPSPAPGPAAVPPPPAAPSGPPPVTYHRAVLDGSLPAAPPPRVVVPAYGYGMNYGYDYYGGGYFCQSVAADIATVAAFTALDFMLW
jgi:Zn-finger nucleic acid-binding protein